MASWRFVGRADELSLLAAAAAGETGRGLVVSGAPGVGKSRLLRECLRGLDARRLAVWSAAANAATKGLPFGGFAHALPAEQPPGLTPAGLLRWAVDMLYRHAAGRPIVFAVDDIHLLDPLSAAFIYVVARSEHAIVLATLRSGEQVPDHVAALWREDLTDRVELAPLSTTETAKLLTYVLGGAVDPATADKLHRLSQGNALLLRELVLSATASADLTQTYGLWRWTGRLELAPSLLEVVDARIGQLNDSVRTVVELVALGEPLGLSLLTALSDPGAVETAEERQLIRVDREDRRVSVRLAHPLYGEVVRQRCPVTRTHRLLARLAGAIEQSGARRRDDLLRVAVWRLESSTARDPVQLLEAGRQAFATFDIRLAGQLVAASLELGGGFDAAELLATILMFSDQPENALAVLEAVRGDLSTPDRLSRWHGVRALVANWGLQADGTADELAAAAQGLDDPEARTWLMAFETIVRLHRLDTDEAMRLAHAVLAHPAASASSRALASSAIAQLEALRGATTLSARTVSAIDADADAWRAENPHMQLAVELARGTGLILAGDFAAVDDIGAAEFTDLTDAGDFRLGSGYLSVLLGQAARLRGRLGEAMRRQRKACAVLATSRVFAGLANAERAHTAALAGSAEEAREAMAEADRLHDRTMAVLYPWLEHARCWVQASLGDVDGAAEMALALAARLRADSLSAHEAIALHDAARLGRAEDAVDRLSEIALQVDGPVAGCMAGYASAVVKHDGPALLDIADSFAGLGLHLYAAEAAAMGYNLLHSTRSGDLPAAAERLAAYLNYCDDPHTPALVVSRPALSERELQIARLAATGVTSREIAKLLFLSSRTIDNHLRSVYEKLGVSGRGELAAALRAVRLAGPALATRRRGGQPRRDHPRAAP